VFKVWNIKKKLKNVSIQILGNDGYFIIYQYIIFQNYKITTSTSSTVIDTREKNTSEQKVSYKICTVNITKIIYDSYIM